VAEYQAMSNKEKRKAMEDCLMYGTGILITGYRKWYNPMRWIKGLMYEKRVNPEKFYVKNN
jgi:hypothetical protein